MIYLANLPALLLTLAACGGLTVLAFKRLDDDEPMQAFAAWACAFIVGILALLSIVANVIVFARQP